MLIKPSMYGNNIETSQCEINHKLINSVLNQDLFDLAGIQNYQRKISIIPAKSILKYRISNIEDDIYEDYILVENVVTHLNTPIAYDRLYNKIQHSFMYSAFLFVKTANNNYQDEMFLLYGFSTGFGCGVSKTNQIQWLPYGYSVLDKVDCLNNYNDDTSFTTSICDLYGQCDDTAGFIGSLYPNLYTEEHYEVLTKNKYIPQRQKVKTKYYLKDFCDNKTKVKKIIFEPKYYNKIDEHNFYTTDAFSNICFELFKDGITNINIIYHSTKGLNFDSVKRVNGILPNKNSVEISQTLGLIVDQLKKMICFYELTINETDFCIFISADEVCFGLKVISKNKTPLIEIKISKAEMIEKMFQLFQIRIDIIKSLNKSILKKNIEDYSRKNFDKENFNEDKSGYLNYNDYNKNPEFFNMQ